MTRSILRAHWIAMLMAVLGAVVFFYARSLNAADERIPIYFEESTLTVRVENVNRTLYLPLIDIIDHVHLPYTNATVLETFTIGTKNSGVVVVAKNSRLILVNGQQTLLGAPVLRENQQWMVPVDFLSQAITRISGIEFRYKPGARRIFAGKAKPNELLMNAQALGSITRLTIGTTAPVTLELQRDAAQHRSVLLMKPKVVDPLREHLEYRDRLVRSIDFEDSDGAPKIIVETSDSASDVRLSSADEGRVHFIDFLGFSAATGVAPPPAAAPTAPAPAPAPAAAPKLDPGAARRFRVVVIDPGHGGTDAGTAGGGIVEKDLTLVISRSLRDALRHRLGVTVLLTRDSDVALSNEARSAVANNNQANLFISLHIGYSPNKVDSGSSIYVIKEDFAAKLSPASSGDRLFLPWYMGYRSSLQASAEFAGIVQEELNKAVPEWKFPKRSGPIAVLSSAGMPAIALEIGNLSTAAKSQIMDPMFQGRVVSTIVAAVERFATRRVGL